MSPKCSLFFRFTTNILYAFFIAFMRATRALVLFDLVPVMASDEYQLQIPSSKSTPYFLRVLFSYHLEIFKQLVCDGNGLRLGV